MSPEKRISKNQNSKDELIEIRRLTVSGVFLNDGYRKNDYASRILLFGKWVRKCGFGAEDKLTVWIYKGRIVVEKEDPDTIDTKLLARVQKQSDESLKQKIKSLVSPEVFARLSFENGDIKWIK